ncbi:MAG TPA: ABC transporter permease [Candidatus Kryptonia bacterium]
MIKNYLRVALRNIAKYRSYSIINIVGLAVGIACCIAILLFVRDELSYDRFNVNADQTYRIHFHAFFNNKDINLAASCDPLEPTLLRDFPEVTAATRVTNFGFPVLRYKDKAFSEERFYWADSTFFDVFTVKFISGNPKTSLTQPNTVVITQAMAKKYFGNEDPMGKVLNADRRRDYIVTGVVDGFPQNSHFQFDFLGSMVSYPATNNQFWLSNNCYTYAVLRSGTDPVEFEKKMNDDLKKYIGPQLKTATGATYEQLEAAGNRVGFYLQPLTWIHLHSHLDYEIEPNSDIAYVWVFSAIALSILLIACINFMNLSTARSERRAKEVGIRKTLGSTRGRLIYQFMSESTLMSLIAVFLAVGLVELLLPLFNDVSGKQLSLGIFDNFYSVPLLILFALIVGLLAGSYPAFYLSSFLPVDVLKSDGRKGSRKSLLRSTLVISQFVVSIVLFISTLIIYDQLNFIQDKNLGFNKEQVVIINKTDDIGAQLGSFKQELLGNPAVISVSNSTGIPGDQVGDNVFEPEGGTTQDARSLRTIRSDYDFAKTYQIQLVAGRFLSVDHPSDSMAVVLNEAAVDAFGIKDPVGKYITELPNGPQPPPKYEIVGVMKDFNYESLRQVVRPLAMGMFPRGGFGKFVAVRIAPGDYERTMAFLEATWKKYAGNEAFEGNFLDQNLERLYRADIRTSKIAAIFSILAIFIACLGLLGLAAFITEQRTKEIGIRKVLGATVTEVVALLSSEFAKWLLIANVIAWPLAYFMVRRWLQDFAYRVDIALWIFIVSGIMAFIIALLTVSTHAIKAATKNPVESLRYE